MRREYVSSSLETHLFFARIMKEHALFLAAGFPACEAELIQRADKFREEFEDGLRYVVRVSNGRVGRAVLQSGEAVTDYTRNAEERTKRLAGADIDTQITEATKQLRAGRRNEWSEEEIRYVGILNRHMLELVEGLIAFKEEILCRIKDCNLYTANYPLLIEHILREAKLYRETILELEKDGCVADKSLQELELFWNQIMMEHAQFIAGLLDPVECDLIERADGFAETYCKLLEETREKECRVADELMGRTIRTTRNYRDFKAAGTDGITNCKIRSIILPLLADHTLREVNHYLRILESMRE